MVIVALVPYNNMQSAGMIYKLDMIDKFTVFFFMGTNMSFQFPLIIYKYQVHVYKYLILCFINTIAHIRDSN